MNHDHDNHEGPEHAQRTVSRSKVVTIGFLLVIGYFLWTEHRAHFIQFLPFLIGKDFILLYFMDEGSNMDGILTTTYFLAVIQSLCSFSI